MRGLRDWEPGLGARAGSPCDCHVSLRVLPALPRKHSLSDSACCCTAPQQNSSLKLVLKLSLCWVLPPRWGHTPCLGCWLPSHWSPAMLITRTNRDPACPARGTYPRLCQEEAAPCLGLEWHTPSGYGCTGVPHKSLSTGDLFFLLFCQLFFAAEEVRSVEEYT